MNKAELITSMAEKSQLTKKDAEAALKAFIDSVQEALENGEKVQLVGFGTFGKIVLIKMIFLWYSFQRLKVSF